MTSAAAPTSSTVWGVAERIVVTPVGRVRSEIVRLLGQHSFTLSTDQLTVIEGSRGSAFAGASRSPSKVPLSVRVRLTAGDPGCAIWMEVRDTWKLPMSRPVAIYQDIIAEVIGGLDESLRRLDPQAEAFTEPVRSWHGMSVDPTGGQDGAAARMMQATNRYLDHDGGDAPKGWQGRGMVSVMTPKGVADLPIDTLYGMVTAGTLVASRPGPMPTRLVSQVEVVTGMMERMLETAGGWGGNSWLELDEKAVPVVEFLVQQAKIREAVPLRTLQVCVTCRLAKVINPDYSRLRSRTNKLRTLQSSVGMLISSHGISPFVLIGKLTQLNQLDPEFVCPRCQGLHAENSIITFCPQCGEQRDEAALRECGKCHYDFRTLAKTKDLWHEPPALPAGAVVAPGQFGWGTPGVADPHNQMYPPVDANGYPIPLDANGYPLMPVDANGYPMPGYPVAATDPNIIPVVADGVDLAGSPTGSSTPAGFPAPTPFPTDTDYQAPVPAPADEYPGTPFPGQPAYPEQPAYPAPGMPEATPFSTTHYPAPAFPTTEFPAPFPPAQFPPAPFPPAPETGYGQQYPPTFVGYPADPQFVQPMYADGSAGYGAEGYVAPAPVQTWNGTTPVAAYGMPVDQAGPYPSGPMIAVPTYDLPPNLNGGDLHLLPAWYPDPSGRHQFRWWDGVQWGEFVLDDNDSGIDQL